MNALTTVEQSDLLRLESIVERTRGAATEFFEALKQIRIQRLYRDQFDNWDDYCAARWQTTGRSLNRGLEAHQIRQQLATDPKDGQALSVISDKTALALKNVKPNLRKKVAKRALKLAGDQPVNHRHVKRAAGLPGYSDPKPLTFNPYSSATTPTEPLSPGTPPPTVLPTTTPAEPLPPVTDPKSAENRLRAYYKANTLALNSLAPTLILERLIKALF